MKRLINIQNNIHRVIYYLSITILMCGGIICLFPPTDAIAETKQECQREIRGISGKLGAKPSPKAYSKALRYCMAGDMRSATNVLQTDSGSGSNKKVSKSWCKEELRAFDMRLGGKTSKKSFSKAQRYCQQGDLEKAHNLFRAAR